jgi:ABC-type transport system substrate-binding protein
MQIRRLLGLGLVALTAVVGGCGGSSGTGKIVVNATVPASAAPSRPSLAIARSSDITSLNPQELNIGEDYETQEALYAGLVRASADGKTIEGDLAYSWSFDEPTLTYTFKLRDGLEFSNATPITAADIVYSIEYAAKGEEYEPLFSAIKSVTAPAPNEIKIKLSRYSNLVLPGLAFAFVLPRNLDGEKPVDFFKDPVSSGEYSLASWSPNNQMVLAANPHYWDRQVVLTKQITFQIIPDENARLNALQAGNVQLDEYVPDEQVAALSADQLVLSNPRSSLILLETNNGRPPFNRASDREAVALAIDRPLILKTIWGGAGVPSQGLLPPDLEDSHPTPSGSEVWAYDPSKATAILAGAHPSVTLLASYERGIDSRLVDVLQQELEQVGFHVTVDVRDFASAVTQLLSGDFSLFLSPQDAFLPTVGEPITTYLTLGAPSAHWDTKVLAGYLNRFSLAKTLAGRRQAGVEFERGMHSEWVVSPVGNPGVYLGVDKDLRGLLVQPFGTYRLGSLQIPQ